MTVKKSVRAYRNFLLEALESGEYKQGKGRLRKTDDSFCCIGVACDIFDKQENQQGWLNCNTTSFRYMTSTTVAPEFVLNEYQISEKTQHRMILWNDNEGLTFTEIAAKLRTLWNISKENQ
jgi:hypothetical protein